MREVIATNAGPQAIGPYSQAVKANGFVFLSGQIALDPATQQLIDGDVSAQTERVLQNLSGILQAAGSSLAQVVKTTVFLKKSMAATSCKRHPHDPRSRSHACPKTSWSK
jgi:2-iminobutanoate/2-iminopropanoate deaminase